MALALACARQGSVDLEVPFLSGSINANGIERIRLDAASPQISAHRVSLFTLLAYIDYSWFIFSFLHLKCSDSHLLLSEISEEYLRQ